jgi:hypothetical protein
MYGISLASSSAATLCMTSSGLDPDPIQLENELIGYALFIVFWMSRANPTLGHVAQGFTHPTCGKKSSFRAQTA